MIRCYLLVLMIQGDWFLTMAQKWRSYKTLFKIDRLRCSSEGWDAETLKYINTYIKPVEIS